ncbi:hypothetical protein BD847_2777 [Flavobacterium cutihirudinis]|uniref:Uncharacterized protein n=1 Tax=Flavobacterium cutihirudinis TaxID=1265740 RepID=A0A3D9FSV3_9FLAO|nr:hypothetical protein [Flavobacterium cutihirudinis]RED23713.1 hypothetical protein BD847_2777 [Flavobacterium cutihirudinis]
MEINWYIFTGLLTAIVLLVTFLIRQNKKDRIKIEEELNYLKEIEEAEFNNDLHL